MTPDTRGKTEAERYAEIMRVVRWMERQGFSFTDRHGDKVVADGHKFRAAAQVYATGGGR